MSGRAAPLLFAPGAAASGRIVETVRRAAASLLAALGMLAILLPLALTLYVSVFNEDLVIFPPRGYTLRWYAEIIPNFGGPLLTSFEVAGAAVALAMLLGVPAGIGLSRYRFAGRDALATFLLAPLTVPGVAIGLGIYCIAVLIEESSGIGLTSSVWLLISAHVLITLPWVVRLCLAGLANHDPAAEEAASSLGAGPLRVIWRVTLPAMRSGIVAAGLFAFVASFSNLEMTLFLVGPGVTTLPIAVLQYLIYHIDPLVSALAVAQIIILGLLLVLLDRFVRLRSLGRMSSSVILRKVSKHYGLAAVVDEVSFEVAAGEMLVLLGPSGCGKTTTLRLIAGFVEPTGGDILLDGVSIMGLPPHRREMGIVFQSYALFPHLSVARNVAFGLEMRSQPRARIRARVAEMLRLVNLESLEDRLPKDLSGGQQQRVALARALAINPRILLFDEPLSNLDAELRLRVARDIRLLQRDNGLTAILVTHDQAEAMAMGDRLVVMKDGRVQQIGDQEDLYERPATPFVAGFIGHSNLLPGRLSDGRRLEFAGASIVPAGRYPFSGDATLAVRPERISLAAADDASAARVTGQVELSTYLGAAVEHSVRIGGDTRVLTRGPAGGPGAGQRFAPGSPVALNWDLASERLFDAADHVVAPATALG